MILIILDKNLEIYESDENDEMSYVYIENRIEIDGKLKPLNLCDKFSSIWDDYIAPIIELNGEILFVLGPLASFTDTRVVWVWLKSNKMFNGISFYFYKDNELKISFESFNINCMDLKTLINISDKNPISTNYLKEPSIGAR